MLLLSQVNQQFFIYNIKSNNAKLYVFPALGKGTVSINITYKNNAVMNGRTIIIYNNNKNQSMSISLRAKKCYSNKFLKDNKIY